MMSHFSLQFLLIISFSKISVLEKITHAKFIIKNYFKTGKLKYNLGGYIGKILINCYGVNNNVSD